MTTELLTERHGQVLVLTLSGPATRNAMTAQVYAAGTEALHAAEANDEIRCIVLTGAGGHFCAGRDIHQMARHRARDIHQEAEHIDTYHRWVEDLISFPKPILAAVEGVAAGAGVSLMLACDMVYASESARFISAYGHLGLSPDGGLSWQIAHRLPRGEALKWLWGQAEHGAQQLHQWGLVQDVVPAGQALQAALKQADQLSQCPPALLASTKELLRAAHTQALPAQLHLEKHHFMVNLSRPEAGQALARFMEKKTP